MIIFMELFIKNVFLEKHKNTKVKKKIAKTSSAPMSPIFYLSIIYVKSMYV